MHATVAAHYHSRLVGVAVFSVADFSIGTLLKLVDVVVGFSERFLVIDPSRASVACPRFGITLEELCLAECSGCPTLATGHDGFGCGVGADQKMDMIRSDFKGKDFPVLEGGVFNDRIGHN